MLFLPAKSPVAGAVEATLVKAVVSAWPRLSPGGAYAGTICNVSATVTVAPTSAEPLRGVLFLLPAALCVQAGAPLDISATLLDPANPLSYTTQGRYRKEPGADRLLSYDGLPDVVVECVAAIDVRWVESEPFGRISVRFDSPVAPGETRAVRFCFEAHRFFSESADGALHFHVPIQSDEVIRQQLSDDLLERISLPTLSVAHDGISGGFDLFFYMPLEYEGERFSRDPASNLLTDYDHLGNQTEEPRRKFAWTGPNLFSRPGKTFALGENLAISGIFKRRAPMSNSQNVNNIAGSVFIGSTVSGSAVSHGGSATAAAPSSQQLLELLEELRESARLLPADDPRVDLIETHANAVAASVREGEPDAALRRLPLLRDAAQGILEYSPRVLDLVDRVGRLLGA